MICSKSPTSVMQTWFRWIDRLGVMRHNSPHRLSKSLCQGLPERSFLLYIADYPTDRVIMSNMKRIQKEILAVKEDKDANLEIILPSDEDLSM